MSEEDIPEKKLKRPTATKDLTTAIERLEREKKLTEEDLKDEAYDFFESLKPINVLNNTLQNLRESSAPKYMLFKKSLAFGAGYLSKRKLIRQLKQALIDTFKGSQTRGRLILKVAADCRDNTEINIISNDNKKENNYMNSQIEKVKAKPEILPEPTYWPFFLALGILFLGWGLLTTWLISLAGFIVMIISLKGWINILRHE